MPLPYFLYSSDLSSIFRKKFTKNNIGRAGKNIGPGKFEKKKMQGLEQM